MVQRHQPIVDECLEVTKRILRTRMPPIEDDLKAGAKSTKVTLTYEFSESEGAVLCKITPKSASTGSPDEVKLEFVRGQLQLFAEAGPSK